MGSARLVARLAAKNLLRRPTEAVMLLLAIVAATAVLSVGLALRGVTTHPYAQTRTATAGPDLVASGLLSRNVGALLRIPGVVGHSGPFPVAFAVLHVHGVAAMAQAEGRSQAVATIDQPKLTAGTWVRRDEVVVERTFADALGVTVGERVNLAGHEFRIAGIAVTAAVPEFPQVCSAGCYFAAPQQISPRDTGLVWLTEADARSLATTASPLTYSLNLQLRDPAAAAAIATAYNAGPAALRSRVHADVAGVSGVMLSWQKLSEEDGLLVADGRQVLLVGSWLLMLLALAGVAVLAGGRMAEQTRRVGLLKAVGASPATVAAVLLAEYVALALVAAAVGLVAGWLAAPLVTNPGAGLLGTPGAPALTVSNVLAVFGAALAVALVATAVPVARAARTSTARGLTDAARPPRRWATLIAITARLPVSLLIGLRLTARRPRRSALNATSVAITVTMVVAALAFHATTLERRFGGGSGLRDPVAIRDSQVGLVITVVLVVLAALNVLFVAWATAIDARRASAVVRALGATPRQVGTGLSVAQALSTLPGAIVGVPLGIGLFAAANGGDITTVPPAPWLVATVLGTVATVAVLAAIPARVGARQPVAEVLQAELI